VNTLRVCGGDMEKEYTYEPDDCQLTPEQLEEIQRVANERYFAQTGKHLLPPDDPSWVSLFD